MDLVVVSLEPWDEVWRRNQHLLAGLLRAGDVQRLLLVEPAADPVHAARSRERPRRGSGLRVINNLPGVGADRLWAYQPTKWLPRRLNSRSDARWAASVKQAAKHLVFVNPVLWVNDPLGAELMAATEWPTLYDITDDWLMADRPDVELTRLRRQEAQLFETCREVVVCSEQLRRAKSRQRDVVLIPNAVDLDAYRQLHPRPADLPDGQVALYLGTAHRDRVDVELCVATAERLARRSGRLVLVGPAPLPSEDLRRFKNAGIRVLGPRPSKHVPAYLQHADVLLVPHVLTEFTASLDPIKAYEYRAARRSVVSTPVAGFKDVPDPLVTSVSPDKFPAAVAEVISDPLPWSPDLPDDIPTWTLRVQQMAAVISRVAETGASS